MRTRRSFLLSAAALATGLALRPARAAERFAVSLSEAQWRARLSPAQYAILRGQGTEPPYSSPLNAEHRPGLFACAGCDQPLFSSAAKFDSHTGWPSFWAPLRHAVDQRADGSFGLQRTEVHCARCGGHLGHVFDDGPPPTGLRYCMNGLALRFTPGTARPAQS
ncbi:peptide methionine sulfoxide reductase MsrB [mine drainage metagenome]|uniref:Peptide methionine sulfoxide reductase MsrB n=1 Tax=mine drainage metagenome TaxID=410659 RepID=A0A1J5T7E7_9ZZZZ